MVNILPHTVEKTSGGYTIRIFKKIDADEDSDSTYCWEPCDTIEISDKNLLKKKDIGDYKVLYFKDSEINVLFLPKFPKKTSQPLTLNS